MTTIVTLKEDQQMEPNAIKVDPIQYDIMVFPDDSERGTVRTIPVDTENLSARCCAHCEHWIDAEKPSCFGTCTYHSDQEWDAFTWADGLCKRFEPEISGGDGG